MLNATSRKARALHTAIVYSIALTSGASAVAAAPIDSLGDRVLNGLASPAPAAYHPRTQRLLVATAGEVRAAALTGEARLIDERPVHVNAGNTILRLRVDARRNRLWVLDTDAVHVFDLASNRRLRTVALPNWFYAGHGTNCLPDLQLDRNGAAFVSDNMQPKLWRIDPVRFSVDERSVRLEPPTPVDAGFSALVIGKDGTMLAAMAAPGFLWRVDTRLFRAEKIQTSERLHGACAIEAAGSGKTRDLTLFVLASGRGNFTVRRVDMASSSTKGRVSDAGSGSIAAPVGLLAANGALQLVLSGAAARAPRTDTAQFVLRPVQRLD